MRSTRREFLKLSGTGAVAWALGGGALVVPAVLTPAGAEPYIITLDCYGIDSDHDAVCGHPDAGRHSHAVGRVVGYVAAGGGWEVNRGA